MKTRALLTGAATMLGAEILKELLLRTEVEAILLLMPAEESVRRRDFERLVKYIGPMPPSVRAVASDLRLPRFGLSMTDWEELATSFEIGFHCAQREVKDQNLELSRQANLRPVETWIQLLKRNPELRLHHLSTAFTGGARRGLFTEFDLDCGQGFHNAWERSLFEAETRLRESKASERVTIYRPSHMLGRADTGRAFQLGGAYPLLAALAASSVLPGDGRARIDFVPADYVAASIVSLAWSGATGTFHLACGWETSLPVRQAATLAAKGRGRSRGARLVPRGLAWPLRLAGVATNGGLASRSLAFATARDLLHQGPVFDTYLADLALEPLGISRPAPENWLESIVRYAETHGWDAPTADEFEKPVAAAALPDAAAEAALIRKDSTFREKRFHQIGEVNVAYRDIGEGEPVVFLHGLAGADSWDGVVQRLATNRRALIVETFGLSDTVGPASADFGLQAQAARVRGLLSALEIASAHIVGNDTGGVIAQLFSVRWPSCVKSLVLSDCHANGAWPPAHLAKMAGWMGLPGGAGALSVLLRVPALARSKIGFGQMVHDKRLLTTERLTRYRETMAGNRARRMRLKGFFRSFEPADLANINQMLEQIETPTMVVWGADNAHSSPSFAKTLYDLIPGSRRLELIPFAGISCHEERPDIFARLLTEFFDEIAAEDKAQKAQTTTNGHP
jgi:pimeloyl-ACP methyl ester carboxylesterase/nucleoside-diphosphate-sugar epimerase